MKLINPLPVLHELEKYALWQNQWTDKSMLGYNTYISEIVHPEDFLISSKIFFPEFIEINDCIFLSDRYVEDNYKIWMEKLHDKASVEKIINHTHIYDIFSGSDSLISDSIFIQIAEVLKYSWSISLSKNIPDKKFIVEISCSELEYGPVLTFYQDK